MVLRSLIATFCAGLGLVAATTAAALTCDMTGYRPQPGLVAVSEGGCARP